MSGALTRYHEHRATQAGSWHPRTGDPVLVKLFSGGSSSTGATVTTETAIGWTALASGIRWLAETIASLPLRVYLRQDPRGRELQRNSRLWSLLHDEPNPEMTSYEWRDLSQTHAILWGNAYSQIVYNGAGEPIELWPLNPDRVQMDRDRTGMIWYRLTMPDDRPSRLLPANEVLHVRGFSRYGLIGEALPDVFRETIGLGLATEEFAARFFGSGMHAGGILEHPAVIGDQAQERLRKSLENQVRGLDRSHRVLILEEGMKWHQTTIEPEKAQFLELRKFQVTEAARILRIPPHLLYDLERATFSNIEAQGLEVLIYTLTSWLVRWEQRLQKQLVSTKMKNKTFIKFGVEGLLRGDTKSRYEAYALGRQWGWLSANDVRELEDQNPRPGGDVYLEPLNMQMIGPDGTPLPIPTAGSGAEPPPDDEERHHVAHAIAAQI